MNNFKTNYEFGSVTFIEVGNTELSVSNLNLCVVQVFWINFYLSSYDSISSRVNHK